MYQYSCDVLRTIDGDTIDVRLDLGFKIYHKARVRLYGIDTPESRTRDKDEKARGLLAKNHILQALDNGKQAVIQTKLKDSRGKFGRVLGVLVIDGVDINQQMVDEYLAVAYTGQNKKKVEAQHKKNRSKLIKQGRFDPKSI